MLQKKLQWVSPVYGSEYKNTIYFHSCTVIKFYIYLNDYESKTLAKWERVRSNLKIIKQAENISEQLVSKIEKQIISSLF